MISRRHENTNRPELRFAYFPSSDDKRADRYKMISVKARSFPERFFVADNVVQTVRYITRAALNEHQKPRHTKSSITNIAMLETCRQSRHRPSWLVTVTIGGFREHL